MVKRVRLKPSGGKAEGVGYCKPPKSTQFKPGQSGYPKGRPKGSRNFKTDLQSTLQSLVKVNKDGRTRRVSTQRASLMVLREKALGGDSRAIEHLLALALRYDEDTHSAATTEVDAADRTILDDYFHERTAFEARQQMLDQSGPHGTTSALSHLIGTHQNERGNGSLGTGSW
jgi:hypothetical protein